MANKEYKKNYRGFSLLELILAIAIFSLSSIAVGTLLIDSGISARLNTEKTEALFYAGEGIEVVRIIRNGDWATWASLTDGDYALESNGSSWSLSSSSVDFLDNKFTRVISITSSSTATSTVTRMVTSNVSWDLTPNRTINISLPTIFTNWSSVVN